VNQPYFQPGDSFHYSNTNYLLAGLIIKEATDTLVSYKLRQFIINPLNLTSTFFPLEESVPDTIAHGWRDNFEFSYPQTSWTSSHWCASNIYSTAENLVRWFNNLFNSQTVISQSSLNQMLTFVPAAPLYPGGYGLGIYRVTPSGRTKWQHDGFFQRGYRSVTRIDSASGYIISVLINQISPEPDIYAFVNTLDNTIRNPNWCPPTGITQNKEIIPQTFQLYQNYPNPFNPVTKIKFGLPSFPPFTKGGPGGFVTLTICDLLGREIETLVNEQLKPGTYEVAWGASTYTSGVYFYKLTAGDYTESKKMMLIK
jgi:CubicO group peptidase (beta-lactamase class C family)